LADPLADLKETDLADPRNQQPIGRHELLSIANHGNPKRLPKTIIRPGQFSTEIQGHFSAEIDTDIHRIRRLGSSGVLSSICSVRFFTVTHDVWVAREGQPYGFELYWALRLCLCE
jgi:hypothetical protein